MTKTFTIDKSAVMEAVATSTAYTAAKAESQEPAATFRRIATVDEDNAELERFWKTGRTTLLDALKGRGAADKEAGDSYGLTLDVSAAFDDNLHSAVEEALRDYFVATVTAGWYVYTNKGEAGGYAQEAAAQLQKIQRLVLHKKQPQRPTYS